VYRQLAALHTLEQHFVEALQSCRAALVYAERLTQRDPSNTQWQQELALALNNYARTLLTAEPPTLRDPAAALPLAQRAVQLADQMTQTDQAMILDTLAVAHHLTGDQTHATAIAEQALTLVPASVPDAEAAQVRHELETHLATFRAAQ